MTSIRASWPVALLLSLTLFMGVHAISKQDEISATTFTGPFGCDRNSNGYLVTVFNGFVSQTTFTILLDYSGSVSTTTAFVLQPRQYSGQIAVYPLFGGTANRQGIMSLVATNADYNDGQPGIIEALDVECGSVVTSGTCRYYSVPCMVRNGQALGNFFCMMWVYLVLLLIGFAVAGLVYALGKKKLAEGIVLGRTRTVEPRPKTRQRKREVEPLYNPYEETYVPPTQYTAPPSSTS